MSVDLFTFSGPDDSSGGWRPGSDLVQHSWPVFTFLSQKCLPLHVCRTSVFFLARKDVAVDLRVKCPHSCMLPRQGSQPSSSLTFVSILSIAFADRRGMCRLCGKLFVTIAWCLSNGPMLQYRRSGKPTWEERIIGLGQMLVLAAIANVCYWKPSSAWVA